MPELPEVEVTRRAFAEPIAGAHIQSLRMGKPLRWPLGLDPQRLVGRDVLGVRRRGKYLLLDLSEGLLLLHLGMSGSLRFAPGGEAELGPAGAHDHFDLQTSQGLLRLHDPRRFGAAVYVSGEADPLARKLLGRLGMEPLEPGFGFEAFKSQLLLSRMPIKQLLLGGKVVVGVGNIYACEVLFIARIAPTQSAREIGPRKMRALHEAIRSVLAQAVAKGGTTLRDFSAPDGMPGHFQLETQVYGRQGQACQRCAGPIQLLRQGQRSTYYCPRCQK
ncbi:bifunctional DNA-formamidopyrimidine glycosylase/DNA-(apurinic or apyrimidinic site) lyase [Comamonas composti]|uniref:bifunctional DNA-formamidopyrimidine glycosylase/DNA-(apurinic or apyrimidinic site) lyase n=1 Tax=Comamonas composti TaxID=408558 RepID=UPI0004066511|nr:bifunctional DNA-formamidopyrimidine glycosylase/DNA-(apurinic or apyrimidinic site) lyase [Comamonas composti]